MTKARIKAQMLPWQSRDLAGGEGREIIDEEVELGENRNASSRSLGYHSRLLLKSIERQNDV